MNRADVGVIDRRGRARFLKEASLRVGVAHELRREELERHEAAKPEVLGLVDHTHAAGADLGDDAIVGDCLADHQGVTRPECYTCAGGVALSSISLIPRVRYRAPTPPIRAW